MTATPKRRWYQFSLRGLLLAVTLAGILSAVLSRSLYLHRMAVFHDSEGTRPFMNDYSSVKDAVPDAIAAAQHMELAGRYRQAVWRPWTIVDTQPQEVERSGLDLMADELSAAFEQMEKDSPNLQNSQAPAPIPPKE